MVRSPEPGAPCILSLTSELMIMKRIYCITKLLQIKDTLSNTVKFLEVVNLYLCSGIWFLIFRFISIGSITNDGKNEYVIKYAHIKRFS